MLTLRRERWHLKKDLYSRLLENVGEARNALDGLLEMEMSGSQVHNEEGRRTRRASLVSQESKATAEIRRAASVAAMLLTADAVSALHEMDSKLTKALDEPNLFDVFDLRLASVRRAYDVVLSSATADLRISVRRRGC
jgi:hypothetical protein